MAIDEFQLATIEHSGVIESVFFIAVVGGTIVLGYKRWLEIEPEGDFQHYLTYVKRTVKGYLTYRPAVPPPSEGTI